MKNDYNIKEMNEKRIGLQTLQGKLCVALYEKAGDAGLNAIEEIYGDYGYEVGLGLKEKWQPRDLLEASRQFEKMTNEADLPSKVEVKGNDVNSRKIFAQAKFSGIAGMNGDAYGWFSTDNQSIPLEGKIEIIVGSITVRVDDESQ